MKNKLKTSLSLRKLLLSALVATPLATLPAPLWALPSVEAANLTKPSTTSATQLGGNIVQITDSVANRLVLKWNEFGGAVTNTIAAGDTIIWTLPSTSSAVLNMVTTGATIVNGALQSNGTIFIVNTNGITFGSTGRVNAAGLGLSTVSQNEFSFLSSGTLDPTNQATATGDIVVNASGAAGAGAPPVPPAAAFGIDVGTTGSIVLSGRAVDVSGVIRAGTLTVNTNSATTGARVGQAGPLTLGVTGTAATGTAAAIPGTGNLEINSNGGAVVLSGGAAAATTIHGGTLTVNSANGNISQGAGSVTLGDGLSNPRLLVTAGTGTVILAGLNVTGTNTNRLDVTINSAGNTTLSLADDVRLNPSTITGTLSITSTAEDISSGGASTVSGAITLSATTANKDIAFNAAGDITSLTIATHTTNAGNDVTLVSGGSITLPSISLGGNLTVTAATNITQAAATAILQPTADKTARFEATTGSITLDNAGNDFTRVVLRGAPGGVTLRDLDDVTIRDGTDVTGNATITAGNIILGGAAGDVVTFDSNLTLNTTAGTGIGSVSITSGGTGFTVAPAVTIADGGAGAAATATLSVLTIPVTAGGTGFTTAPTVTVTEGTSVATGTSTFNLAAATIAAGGAGFTSAPSVAISGGGGTVTTQPTVALGLNTVTIAGGAGYVVGDTINVTGGGATTAGVLTVTAVDGAGAVTGASITTAGTGFTDLTPAGLAEATATGVGVGANITAATGLVNIVTLAPAGTGFTAQPTVAITGGGGTTAATAVVSGPLATVTVTSGGTGFTLGGAGVGAAETVVASAAGQTVEPTFGAPTGAVTTLALTAPGAGFTSASPTVTFVTAGTGGTGATATALLGGGGGGVTDSTNNITVFGVTQINSAGAVVIDGATSSGIGLNHRFGQINVAQGTSIGGVTLYESTTLNLGAITSGGKLRAYSSAGDVIDTGPIVVGGGLAAAANGAEFGAGTAAVPGNITIDSAGTTISGRIAILDDVALLTNAAANDGAVIGTYLANNVTVNTAGSINMAAIFSTSALGIPGALTLTATGAGSDITLAGATAVAGGIMLNSADDITGENGDNKLGTTTVTAGGNVSLRSDAPFVINATLTENAAGKTATFVSDGALQIGTINSAYTGLVTFEAKGNNALTDNVNGMRVFGPVHFQSVAGITINNTGHSFGRVSAGTSDNNGSITIVESGGLRLGTITTNGTGSFTATSTTGDIFQNVDQNGIRLGNGTSGTATFSAPLGSITLNDNDRTGTTVADTRVNSIAIINATAAGNIVINNPRLTTLGNITTGGMLSVDSANTHTAGVPAAASANNIVQTSSGRVNAFSVVTLTASGAGAITLGNTGNRLGGVIATTGSGAITLNEAPSLNLVGIQTTGGLTATSETGSIVDTAFTIAATASNTTATPVNSLGTAASALNATFSAPNGDIILDLAGNNFGTVGFTAGGNVSILDATGNITLAASTISGALDVLSTAAAGVINQSGVLAVTGNLTLTTSSGSIDLSNTANMFGGIRFTAGNAGVLISENTTLNLRGGSTSTGPVQLVTNGSFITSGSGASTVTNDLTIQAVGTIIPGAGSLLVTGVFRVFSPALKDLSLLSKSGNLLGRDPVNLGTGAYVPPGP